MVLRECLPWGRHFLYKGKTIFISPLDWGLGHATRCVPIIRELEKENKIIIGISSVTKSIFDQEFPHLQKVEVPSYNIRYSAWLPLWAKLLLSWPSIKKVIVSEKKRLDSLVKELNPDIIISDNRFGLCSPKVYSIFVTHQLFLKTPFASAIAQKINKKYILKFNEVWVPDYDDTKLSLAGELSHGEHIHSNVKYIGPKSRLTVKEDLPIEYDVLFLLSGPEPQQSILGKKLLDQFSENHKYKLAMVSHTFKPLNKRGLQLFMSPDANTLSNIIAKSKVVICRSGYSTLMDMHLLNKKKLILIPTPGQTEQEYLAHYWHKKLGSHYLKQNEVEKLNQLLQII